MSKRTCGSFDNCGAIGGRFCGWGSTLALMRSAACWRKAARSMSISSSDASFSIISAVEIDCARATAVGQASTDRAPSNRLMFCIPLFTERISYTPQQ